jgi:hypothetical protein
MSTSRRPADIARRSAKALHARPRDAFRRETFALPREKTREKARKMGSLDKGPLLFPSKE